MTFDPFSDRLARDIRNSLSAALIGELTDSGAATVSRVAEDWLAQQLDNVFRVYVLRRRREYLQIISHIQSTRIDSPHQQAIVLWNAGLYFELHELLETIWHGAPEPVRTGLKGLIQAAGAYLHLQRGKSEAAQKLALRARAHLRAGAATLSFVANLEQLIAALADTPPTPLRLTY